MHFTIFVVREGVSLAGLTGKTSDDINEMDEETVNRGTLDLPSDTGTVSDASSAYSDTTDIGSMSSLATDDISSNATPTNITPTSAVITDDKTLAASVNFTSARIPDISSTSSTATDVKSTRHKAADVNSTANDTIFSSYPTADIKSTHSQTANVSATSITTTDVKSARLTTLDVDSTSAMTVYLQTTNISQTLAGFASSGRTEVSSSSFETSQEEDVSNETSKRLIFFLMGNKGEGKSATGNTILNRKAFTSSTSLTERADIKHGDVERGDIKHGDVERADIKHGDVDRANIKHEDAEKADIKHGDAEKAGIKHGDAEKADIKACNPKRPDVRVGYAELDNVVLKVVDGISLDINILDTSLKNNTAMQIMNVAVTKCCEGVDVFLLIIKFGSQFTAKDLTAVRGLKVIFGETYMEHMIVVITGGDLFKSDMRERVCDISFDEWCRKQPAETQNLYRDCNGRFVLLNNKEKNEEIKMAQIQHLLQMAEDLKAKHDRYDSDCFQRARVERRKMIFEKKAPELEEDIQEKINLLTADIDAFVQQYEQEKGMIVKRINDLSGEIEIQDKGYNVLGDLRGLVDKVRENLDHVDTLQNLGQEMEKIRMARNIWAKIGSVCRFVGGVLKFTGRKLKGVMHWVNVRARKQSGSSDRKSTQ